MQNKGEENKQKEQLLSQKQKEKDLLDLMIKNHKENELLIKKQKEQDYFNPRQPLSKAPNQLYQKQNQQKKNTIPKNPASSNLLQNNIHNNYFIEQTNGPRDSMRSKNSKMDQNQNVIYSHLPKVESGSSYQLLGNNYMNLNGDINQNYNNYDFLSNTNYNINTQNINDIRYNQ